jgi:hypothetical protein
MREFVISFMDLIEMLVVWVARLVALDLLNLLTEVLGEKNGSCDG